MGLWLGSEFLGFRFLDVEFIFLGLCLGFTFRV